MLPIRNKTHVATPSTYFELYSPTDSTIAHIAQQVVNAIVESASYDGSQRHYEVLVAYNKVSPYEDVEVQLEPSRFTSTDDTRTAKTKLLADRDWFLNLGENQSPREDRIYGDFLSYMIDGYLTQSNTTHRSML